jgi:hypothetical protein
VPTRVLDGGGLGCRGSIFCNMLLLPGLAPTFPFLSREQDCSSGRRLGQLPGTGVGQVLWLSSQPWDWCFLTDLKWLWRLMVLQVPEIWGFSAVNCGFSARSSSSSCSLSEFMR